MSVSRIIVKGVQKNLTDQMLFSLYLGPRCLDLQHFGVYPPLYPPKYGLYAQEFWRIEHLGPRYTENNFFLLGLFWTRFIGYKVLD
jgi:hypothetical protein